MANTVTISGMFGRGKTYFADSPVVIGISGLAWPNSSPFTIVRMEVVYGGAVVGDFRADTGKQTSIAFDISSALRAIWFDYGFTDEVAKAQAAVTAAGGQTSTRSMREYILRIYTEYISDDDGGVFTVTQCHAVIDGTEYTDIPGGQCLPGGFTEWERSLISDTSDADVLTLEHTNARNGDASTKPVSTPERVGEGSITSWVDVQAGLTRSIFYPAPASAVLPAATGDADDSPTAQGGWTGHRPLVLRDSQPYVDFLFVNRRGAVETCSGLTKESMGIDIDTKTYGRVERPTFRPSRSLTSFSSGGRRSWQMSSGYVDREWAEWWALEFLRGRRHWMRYKGSYVPVVVEPAKKSTGIYDRAKQQMPSVEFTVTLALEG